MKRTLNQPPRPGAQSTAGNVGGWRVLAAALRFRRAFKLVAGALVLASLGIMAAWLAPFPFTKVAPVVAFASAEPGGIFDDNGEMLLVTLSLQDPEPPGPVEGRLCLRPVPNPVGARVGDHWLNVPADLTWHRGKQGTNNCLLLLPSGANACRVTLQYSRTTLVFKKHPFKGRVLWMFERLPLAVRRRVPSGFWQWAGFPEYGPAPGWRTLHFELPLSAPSTMPTGAPTTGPRKAMGPNSTDVRTGG